MCAKPIRSSSGSFSGSFAERKAERGIAEHSLALRRSGDDEFNFDADREGQSDLLDAVDTFGAIVIFLADGLLDSSIAIRAAVLLRLLRPQLFEEATDAEVASLVGCSLPTVARYHDIVRTSLPVLGLPKAYSRAQSASLESLALTLSSRRRMAALKSDERVLKAKQRVVVRRRILEKHLKRSREALALIAQGDEIVSSIKRQHRELDALLKKACSVPSETPQTRGLDDFERSRRGVLAARGITPPR